MLMPDGAMAYRFANGGYPDDEQAIDVAVRSQAFDLVDRSVMRTSPRR